MDETHNIHDSALGFVPLLPFHKPPIKETLFILFHGYDAITSTRSFWCLVPPQLHGWRMTEVGRVPTDDGEGHRG